MLTRSRRLPRPRHRLLLAAAAGTLVAGAAGGAVAGPLGGASRDDPTAAAMLRQAADTAENLSYEGTQFVMLSSERESTSALVRVSHVAGQGSVMRASPTVRKGGGRAFHRAARHRLGRVVAPDARALDLLTRNFEVVRDGSGRVAGRAADVVVVRRPGGEPVARFWLDRRTRLVLRRELLDADGRTVAASAFIEINLGGARLEGVGPATPMPDASGRVLDEAALTGLGDDGWQAPRELPGGLRLLDGRLTDRGRGAVLHLSYSDGMSTVSLFQQRGRLDTDRLAGFERARVGDAKVWLHPGFPRRVVWSSRGLVLTVVADCQRATLDQVVAALPHGGQRTSLPRRAARGLARVGSWLNPFA